MVCGSGSVSRAYRSFSTGSEADRRAARPRRAEAPIPLVGLSIVIGFLLGSLPFGLWIGRLRGVDLRSSGSRNIGATNAFRVVGARWGILVFAMDVLKGTLAALAPAWVGSLPAFGEAAVPPGGEPLFLAGVFGGLAAIAGHVFSPWVRFRGGRGVATSLGVFLAIAPAPTSVAFALWLVLLLLSRRVSVGSIGAALVYPFLVFLLLRGDPHRILLGVIASAVALLVIVRHRANIERLIAGTEPPFLGRKAGGRP